MSHDKTYPSIDYFLEMDGHGAVIEIGVVLTIVYEHTDFLRSDFVGTITKHKQHGVNDI